MPPLNIPAAPIQSGAAAASAAAGGYSRYGSAVHKQVYIYGSLDRGPTELTRSYGMAWGIGGWLLTPFLQWVFARDTRRRKIARHEMETASELRARCS